MRNWSRLRSWLQTLLRRSHLESDMDTELRFHIDAYTEDLARSGVPSAEAQRRARLEFGGFDETKEDCRQARGASLIDTTTQDLKYGLRMIRNNPAFAIVAIFTLALGIGASTAIFGVIESVLIEPFPYPEAERMMTVEIHDAGQPQATGRPVYPGPEFLDYAEKNDVFDRVIANDELEVLYTPGDGGLGTHRFHGVLVTPGTFEFFGLPPLIGRVMEPADYEPGASPVFVLRYRTWVSDFAADPSIINKTFVLNGTPRTLIGVMPPRFGWGDGDVFIPEKPVRSEAVVAGQHPHMWYLVGHLKPGVSAEAAEARLSVLAGQLAKIYPARYPTHFIVVLKSLTDMVVGNFRGTLYLILAAVALLLLIGCANVANLMLARSTAREKEFALRLALGASSSRLIRQLLIESFLLAICGGAFGIAMAWAGLKLLISLLPRDSVPAETVIRLSMPVLLFAVAIALLTPLIFGLAPALRSARVDLESTLREGGKGGAGASRQGRMRDLVIIAEVALSFTLLVGAGLLMRGFVALRAIDLGLQPDHVMVALLSLPPSRYTQAAQVSRFFRPLLERVKELPGVSDAAESDGIPPDGVFGSSIDIPGRVHTEQWSAAIQRCSEGYFSAVRMRLLDGRTLSDVDVNNALRVAVVNNAFVRSYLAGVNPLGQRVRQPDSETAGPSVADPGFEIVGVVGDTLNQGLERPPQPEVFVPSTTANSTAWTVLIRTANDPGSVMNDLR
ncbi:MAG TPA: ABC transporter permease, partial [Blastocatellia bacterium]